MVKRLFIMAGLMVLLGGVCILTLAGGEPAPAVQPAADRVNLRILYVGQPRSPRQKDFTAFLKAHFTAVGTADLANFDFSGSEDFDVTVFDYDGDGFKAPRPRLPDGFSRPVVTVGVAGGLMSSNWGLKTGYL